MNTLTLNTTATCEAPDQGARRILQSLMQALRTWIGQAAMGPRGRYLSQAADHADLEMRLQAWEAKQRRDAKFFCGGHWS